MQITFEQFKKLSRQGNLITLFKQIPADLETPVSAYLKMSRSDPSFLLESMEGGEKWGRYSLIGNSPLVTVSAHDTTVEIRRRHPKQKIEKENGNPFEILKREMSHFKLVSSPLLPKLCGGAVGFVGYDNVRFFEKLPDLKRERIDFPDLFFGIYDRLIIFDNLLHSIFMVVNAYVDGKNLKKIYQQAIRDLEKLKEELEKPLSKKELLLPKKTKKKISWKSNMSKSRYFKAVLKAKEYIKAGDIFQVVLSDRWETKLKIDPIQLYRTLRRLNPSPYLFCLKMGKNSLVGSSPEVMVRLDEKQITLRPIAGTKWRGKTTEEDQLLENEMIQDPKERAEHLMLVDLGRNDVGRVAKSGSVKVSELMVVERYSHVMHLVSNVTGELDTRKNPFDVIQSCFPAGTLSGAPKIRAMEIIEELEAARRGPYGGCVGYIDFSGNMDMAITIRSIAMNSEKLFVQSGGGIVYDSDPEKEFVERQNKAKAVMEAVKQTCS